MSTLVRQHAPLPAPRGRPAAARGSSPRGTSPGSVNLQGVRGPSPAFPSASDRSHSPRILAHRGLSPFAVGRQRMEGQKPSPVTVPLGTVVCPRAQSRSSTPVNRRSITMPDNRGVMTVPVPRGAVTPGKPTSVIQGSVTPSVPRVSVMPASVSLNMPSSSVLGSGRYRSQSPPASRHSLIWKPPSATTGVAPVARYEWPASIRGQAGKPLQGSQTQTALVGASRADVSARPVELEPWMGPPPVASAGNGFASHSSMAEADRADARLVETGVLSGSCSIGVASPPSANLGMSGPAGFASVNLPSPPSVNLGMGSPAGFASVNLPSPPSVNFGPHIQGGSATVFSFKGVVSPRNSAKWVSVPAVVGTAKTGVINRSRTPDYPRRELSPGATGATSPHVGYPLTHRSPRNVSPDAPQRQITPGPWATPLTVGTPNFSKASAYRTVSPAAPSSRVMATTTPAKVIYPGGAVPSRTSTLKAAVEKFDVLPPPRALPPSQQNGHACADKTSETPGTPAPKDKEMVEPPISSDKLEEAAKVEPPRSSDQLKEAFRRASRRLSGVHLLSGVGLPRSPDSSPAQGTVDFLSPVVTNDQDRDLGHLEPHVLTTVERIGEHLRDRSKLKDDVIKFYSEAANAQSESKEDESDKQENGSPKVQDAVFDMGLTQFGLLLFIDEFSRHLDIPPFAFGNAEESFIQFDFNGQGRLNVNETYKLVKFHLDKYRFDLGGAPTTVEIPWHSPIDLGYSIIKEIGKGSQGIAKLTRDASNREMCMKVYYKERLNQSGVQDLISEFSTMNMLSCKRIAGVHALFQDDDFYYMACNLHRGGDLNTITERAAKQEVAMTKDWWRNIWKQCIEGLAFMHEQAIMHCDIKEGNIMLKTEDFAEPEIVIIDLGVSMSFKEAEGGISGTPGYVPPETLRDMKWYPRGDIFSLGVAIFQVMCSMHPPESGTFLVGCTTALDVFKATLEREPEWDRFPDQFPALKEMVASMLEKERMMRPRAPQLLVNDWFTMEKLEEEGVVPVTFGQQGTVNKEEFYAILRPTNHFATMGITREMVENLSAKFRQRSKTAWS